MRNPLMLMAGSIIFLSSCRGIPPKSDFSEERCFTVIEQKGIVDNQQVFSGHCRCQTWAISKQRIGTLDEPQNKPLEYCHLKGGFSPNGWLTFWGFLEEWRLYLNGQ